MLANTLYCRTCRSIYTYQYRQRTTDTLADIALDLLPKLRFGSGDSDAEQTLAKKYFKSVRVRKTSELLRVNKYNFYEARFKKF